MTKELPTFTEGFNHVTTPLPRKGTATVAIHDHRREKTSCKFRGGVWPDKEHLTYILDNMPSDAVCLDGGAFLGGHTLAYLLDGRAKWVYAFEPVAISRDRLNWSLWQNNVRDRCDLLPLGLSDKPGAATFKHGKRKDRNLAAARFIDDLAGDFRMVTVDSFGFGRLDVLKIDCENHSVRALAGSMKTIARCKPAVLSIELLRNQVHAAVKKLTALGYPKHKPMNRWDHIFTR
jgi:FkbM family methyltransferase